MASIPQHPPKICLKCGSSIRWYNKKDLCIRCLKVCDCGAKKMYTAAQCKACKTRKQNTVMWQENREFMLTAVRAARQRSRIFYDDLTLESFKFLNHDGRYFARYSTEDGRQYRIFRSRWVWQQANGIIPEDCHIHHINENKTDDRLENLQMLTNVEHGLLHMTEEYKHKLAKLRGQEYTGKHKARKKK